MTCNHCHAPLTEQVSFCPYCGACVQNQWNATPQPQQAPQPQQPPQQAPQQPQQPPQPDPFYSSQPTPPPYYTPPGQTPYPTTEPILFALAYIPILFWLPLAFDKSKSAFGRNVANQGLLLLIVSMMINFFSDNSIFTWLGRLPFFPSSIFSGIIGILAGAVSVAVLVCIIVGFVKALQKEFFEIPLIGHIKLIK